MADDLRQLTTESLLTQGRSSVVAYLGFQKGGNPFSSRHGSPSPPFPSLPLPFLPFSSHTLEVGPLNPGRGSRRAL